MNSVHTQSLVLKAADGHRLEAYLATPPDKPRGAMVIAQEIFGVNDHIRAITRQYAAAGYLAIAPALFDRAQREANIPYADVPAGIALKGQLKTEQTLLDFKAAIDAVAPGGRVGMVGYCWGGTMAYVAGCHLPIAAGVCYYGGGLPAFLDRTPKCPFMFHFGDRDAHIPLSDVEKVKQAYPLGHYYAYEADHGFNCADRAAFDPPSAELAFSRTLDFLHRHVG